MLGSEPRSPATTTTGPFLSRLKTLLCFSQLDGTPRKQGRTTLLLFKTTHRHSSLFFALSCNTTSCFSPSSFSLSSEIGPHYVTQNGLVFRAPEFSSAENTSVSLPSTLLPLQSIAVWLHFPTVLP